MSHTETLWSFVRLSWQKCYVVFETTAQQDHDRKSPLRKWEIIEPINIFPIRTLCIIMSTTYIYIHYLSYPLLSLFWGKFFLCFFHTWGHTQSSVFIYIYIYILFLSYRVFLFNTKLSCQKYIFKIDHDNLTNGQFYHAH